MTEQEWKEKEYKALWKEYCESGMKPADIPDNPEEEYADEWTSWTDFFEHECPCN